MRQFIRALNLIIKCCRVGGAVNLIRSEMLIANFISINVAENIWDGI